MEWDNFRANISKFPFTNSVVLNSIFGEEGRNTSIIVSAGWYQILYDCFTDIYNYLCECQSKEEKKNLLNFKILVAQIEKGRLVFISNMTDEKIDEIMRLYGDISEKTCELCGKTGALIYNDLNEVLCERCKKNLH